MICAECREEGERSTVSLGETTTTDVAYSPFWDEDGVRHVHDPNEITTSYLCSNGHEWSESEITLCQVVGCGYGRVEK